jgi:hypothetical protein
VEALYHRTACTCPGTALLDVANRHDCAACTLFVVALHQVTIRASCIIKNV